MIVWLFTVIIFTEPPCPGMCPCRTAHADLKVCYNHTTLVCLTDGRKQYTNNMADIIEWFPLTLGHHWMVSTNSWRNKTQLRDRQADPRWSRGRLLLSSLTSLSPTRACHGNLEISLYNGVILLEVSTASVWSLLGSPWLWLHCLCFNLQLSSIFFLK